MKWFRTPTPVALCVAGVVLFAADRPGLELLAQAPMDIHLLALDRSDDGGIQFRYQENITARPGYDNQPAWLSDSSGILYTSLREDGQTDIYRYELATRQTLRVTATPESEYSPTPRPRGHFSCVRVEMDGTQLLWSLPYSGLDPRLLLPGVAPVGYHAWSGDDQVALFILGEPHSLYLARVGESEPTRMWPNIARSLQTHPDGRRISFVAQRDSIPERILLLDPADQSTSELAPLVSGGQDHCWTPWGALWMTSSTQLLQWSADSWTKLVDWQGLPDAELTRLAVSPDGKWLALVISEPRAPEPE